jgi:Holliday junction resolvasome RuvABC ATP-dependent DNA helicase subunit
LGDFLKKMRPKTEKCAQRQKNAPKDRKVRPDLVTLKAAFCGRQQVNQQLEILSKISKHQRTFFA